MKCTSDRMGYRRLLSLRTLMWIVLSIALGYVLMVYKQVTRDQCQLRPSKFPTEDVHIVGKQSFLSNDQRPLDTFSTISTVYTPPLNITQTRWLKGKHIQKMSLTELDQRVKHIASPDHWLVISSSDRAFFDLSMNMCLSLKKVGVTNFLAVAYSQSTCDMYHREGVECLVYFDYDIGQNSSDFGSQVYHQKLTLRIVLIYDLLFLGYNVLLVDADIVVFKHPSTLLPFDNHMWHIAGVAELKGINGGFVFYKRSLETMTLLKAICDKASHNPVNDQVALTKILNDRDSFGEEVKQLNLFRIPGKQIFHLCGQWKAKPGFIDEDLKGIVFVHLTCTMTPENKEHVFKSSGMWYYDKDGYYSNLGEKYVTYENVYTQDVSWPSISKIERVALINAMILSTVLNRTLILPVFRCGDSNNNTMACALQAKITMRCFLKTFPRVREHLFLYHMAVPRSVRTSQTEAFSVIQASNGIPTIDIDRVKRWLRPKKESVLSLRSLGYHMSKTSAVKYKVLIERFSNGINEAVSFKKQTPKVLYDSCDV